MSLLNDEVSVRFSDGEQLKTLVSSLLQWGCCVRCIIRFLGVKSADVYRTYDLSALVSWAKEVCCSSEPVVARINGGSQLDAATDTEVNDDRNRNCELDKSVASKEQNNTISEDNPCICCFGVLQDKYCHPLFVKGIAEAVAKQDYEFRTFLCSVSLPVCLEPREHALWLALAELCPGEFVDSEKNAIASVKDVWKWINGPLLASALGVPFDQKSLFEVILSFDYPKNEEECSFLSKLYPDVFRRRKQNHRGLEVFNRSNVARAIDNTKADTFRRHFRCPPSRPQMYAATCPITCQQASLYIAGRYNKYSRHLSQTPWVVDGKRKSESSVEELICIPLNKAVLAAEWRFSSSGREDVDVRMLGTGRPFVVEFINPRRVKFTAEQLATLQDAINAGSEDVAVRDVQIVAKEDTAVLKECEEDKMKRYVALCWSRNLVSDERLASLSSEVNVTLKQKTPIRVLHRRTLATRERTVYNMSAERVDTEGDLQSNYFALSLSTQAGTYVKEFVHGDLGRTEPSLGNILGTECDILALDVVAVELDWPKSLGR